jgi:hypothetical protein
VVAANQTTRMHQHPAQRAGSRDSTNSSDFTLSEELSTSWWSNVRVDRSTGGQTTPHRRRTAKILGWSNGPTNFGNCRIVERERRAIHVYQYIRSSPNWLDRWTTGGVNRHTARRRGWSALGRTGPPSPRTVRKVIQ